MKNIILEHTILLAQLKWNIHCVILLLESYQSWLISEGRDEKALEVLQVIADINGKKLPANLDLSDNRNVSVVMNCQKSVSIYVSYLKKLRMLTCEMSISTEKFITKADE